jgi:PKD repeat protein
MVKLVVSHGEISDSMSLKISVIEQSTAIVLNGGFTVSNAAIETGQSVTYTSTASVQGYDGDLVYMWSFPGATSTTSSEANPVVTYNVAGTYDVTQIVMTSDSAVRDTVTMVDAVVVTGETVGLQGLEQVALVYPNPARDYLNIDFRNASNSGTFKLINALGTVVLTQEVIDNERIQIDQPSGLYFIVLEVDGQKFSQRLVVK